VIIKKVTTKKIVILGNSQTIDQIKQYFDKSKRFNVVFEAKEYSQMVKEYIKADVDLVIVSNYFLSSDPKVCNFIIKEFLNKGIIVKTDFHFYEDIFHRISDESIQQELWLLKSISQCKQNYTYDVKKQLLDFFGAILGVIVFIIPFIVIWICIKIFYGYNPIFKQKRIGYLGKEFYIYKFITIRPKKKNVAEIFKEYDEEESDYFMLGKFIRKFKIDEIPQIINVFKGEMSLVGPRPLWDIENIVIEKEILNHRLRSLVKPGISGLAQVNLKAVKKIEENKIRFAYDIYYVNHLSIFLDIQIILKTIKRLFIYFRDKILV
jgi:lipopolysaccharide/colanic/teichoic acid biosynthesis glycosyltransferase